MRFFLKQAIRGAFFFNLVFVLIACHSDKSRSSAKICRDHFQAESYQVALRSCVVAAENGHLDSQWIAANILMRGLAGEKDMAESVRWLSAAANNGHTAAQRELGKSYMSNARGIEQDFTLALKWLKSAAREGDAEAEFSIGIIFLGSPLRSADQASALRWFKKAAAKGNYGAMNNLAWIYATSPNKSLRNGEQAIKLSKQLLLINPESPTLLDTLAAAYAEAGNFEQAVVHQEKAQQYLPENLSSRAKKGYLERLEFYRQGKPWRESEPDWYDSEISSDDAQSNMREEETAQDSKDNP